MAMKKELVLYLDCPQLKNPAKVERLRVTTQVMYVLEFHWDQPGVNNQALVHAAPRNSVTGLPAITTRLRNGGYLEDVGRDEGGLKRELTAKGIMLVNEVRRALREGYTLPGGTDPREEPWR
jgi:hypothetical protein